MTTLTYSPTNPTTAPPSPCPPWCARGDGHDAETARVGRHHVSAPLVVDGIRLVVRQYETGPDGLTVRGPVHLDLERDDEPDGSVPLSVAVELLAALARGTALGAQR